MDYKLICITEYLHNEWIVVYTHAGYYMIIFRAQDYYAPYTQGRATYRFFGPQKSHTLIEILMLF